VPRAAFYLGDERFSDSQGINGTYEEEKPMAKRLKIKQLSKKNFEQGQEWASAQGDPRLQYLAGLSQGSPLHLSGLCGEQHDNCSFLGLDPKATLPLVVEHGGQVYAMPVNGVLKAHADIDRGILPSGETIYISQPLSSGDLNRIRQCDHDWVVFSTALAEVWLMLECFCCGGQGTIDDPTKEEWGEAFYAPDHPYAWRDKTRVTVRGCLPKTVRHDA
jgi:hypothetical protein